jgi:hypothetical protein
MLENKFKDFVWNEEFPNIYYILLYESGGDFKTYAKLNNYASYEDFVKEYDAFFVKHENKFLKYTDIHN